MDQAPVKKRQRNLFILSFLAPAGLTYLVFVVYPLIQSFTFALYRWRGVSQNRTFVGLENFEKLWKDEIFWRALKNNLWLLVFAGVSLIFLGLAVAHGMQTAGRLSKLLRSVYLFPQVISMVIVAVLWMFLYNPSFGLIDAGLKALHIEPPKSGWLGTPSLALPAVGVAFIWYALGFYIMLFAAGLNGISAEIYEAAELDGAKGLRRFWRVTWPLLWSIRRVAIVYVAINVMNVFALPFLMTNGGPDRATETLLTYLYEQGFKNFEFGYSTAIAAANFVIVMLISVGLLLIFRRIPEGARA